MSKAKVIKDYRLMSLLIAVMASLALVLSGCGTTSAKQRNDSEVVENDPDASPNTSNEGPETKPDKAPILTPGKKKSFGSMTPLEDFNGNVPDGKTLQGPGEARGGPYSYGNNADATMFAHAPTEAYECQDLRALYEYDWESNLTFLEDYGYQVEEICELSLDQADLWLAYGSGLFTDGIDTSDEYTMKYYGATQYTVFDDQDLRYDIFVPSHNLIKDYGDKGDLTADFIFYNQQDPEGGGDLYYNLTADEARAVFYPGA